MKAEEIKEFVQSWMNGHEKDTFIKNENGVVLYSSGHTSLNLTYFFEDLLTDYIEIQKEKKEFESKAYAKDQIEKDRKRITQTYYNENDLSDFNSMLKNTTIILD